LQVNVNINIGVDKFLIPTACNKINGNYVCSHRHLNETVSNHSKNIYY